MPRKKQQPANPEQPEATIDPLTNKQRAFVLEYVKDWNATQAAIRAGYSADTARSIGHENLTKPDIRAEIDRHFADMGLTADRIKAEQMALAFSDLGDFVTIQAGGGVIVNDSSQLKGRTKLIKKIKERRKILTKAEGDGEEMIIDSQIEIELYDKQKALDVLGKVVGLDKSGQETEEGPKAPTIQLSYTDFHNMDEDELLIWITTGALPERFS